MTVVKTAWGKTEKEIETKKMKTCILRHEMLLDQSLLDK